MIKRKMLGEFSDELTEHLKVREGGVEPPRRYRHRILNLARRYSARRGSIKTAKIVVIRGVSVATDRLDSKKNVELL